MLTVQEIFNLSVSRVIAQGEPSMADSICKYRSENSEGKKLACGVGVLIADEDYRPEFDRAESTSVLTLMHESEFASALSNAGVDVTDRDVVSVLTDVQRSHDYASTHGSRFTDVFKQELKIRMPLHTANCPSFKD